MKKVIFFSYGGVVLAVSEILLEKTRRLGDGCNLNLGVSAPNIVHPIVTLIRVSPSGRFSQLIMFFHMDMKGI